MIFNEEVTNACISKYGKKYEMDMAIEETAELIQATLKCKRKLNKDTKEHLIEEIADVLITIEGIKNIYTIEYYKIQECIISKNSEEYNLETIIEIYAKYIKAICDCKINFSMKIKEHLIEKIADILISIELLKNVYDIKNSQVQEIINYKFERQANRIDNEIKSNVV